MHLKLALDWTPNTLHAGILLAEAQGYYRNADLQMDIISPADDHYAVTPAKKLADKKVHLAITPSESVISFNMREDPVPLRAIAANLQQDTSAIVTLESSGIERPSQMDGRHFASYNARFENDIVRQMVKNDGGQGALVISNPSMLSMWDNLIAEKADATWVFLPWEGVKAKHEHQSLAYNAFQLGDFQVPYGYSPLLVSHQDFIEGKQDALKAFVQATEKGWRDVHEKPEKAAQLLQKFVDQPEMKDIDFVLDSLHMIQPALLTEDGRWGYMKEQRWTDFVSWLVSHQILKNEAGVPYHHNEIEPSQLYTNIFFA